MGKFKDRKTMTTLRSNTSGRVDAQPAQQEKYKITFATLEDVESLVALHYKCFSKEDHIAMMFGKPFVISAYRWFVTSPETFVLVARQGNGLIGFTAVAEGPYDGPMLRAGWREAIKGLTLHPWLAFHPELVRRFVRSLLKRNKGNLDDKVAHIAFTGVDPQFQGMGIGRTLKKASIRTCRERGMRAIITGVKKQNMRARAMNESAGFVEVPELRTKTFVYLRLNLDQ
jgi:ribosomal protein S18 acetylase RimI-like enzyme